MNVSQVLITKTFLEDIFEISFQEMGRGCGSVGRAVAPDTRGPQFESSLRPTLNWTLIFLLSTVLKRRNKEKDAGNGPFF